ncbi:MAG TPA: carboxypeptidase-like regulatory domain-containing protein, partial [Albitalea sp.]
AGAQARLRATQAHAHTGADGRYRLSPLLPGAPTLEIRAPGYATGTRKLGLAAGQLLNVDIALSKT